MTPRIDFEALDELARRHVSWRASSFTELSPTYVSGEGDTPTVFIVGEAPGAQEEIRRRPFVGRSGLLLRELMKVASLFSTDWQTEEPKAYGAANCWLTNTVKFRPPRNATPDPAMVDSVRHLLLAEWKAVGSPHVVVPVGNVALRAVMGVGWSILAIAGKGREIVSRGGDPMVIWPMIHPAMVLRETSLRSKVEEHWSALGEYLDGELG